MSDFAGSEKAAVGIGITCHRWSFRYQLSMSLLDRLFSIGVLRKGIWRCWYPFLTDRLQSEDVLFLNYAFQSDPPERIALEKKDEPDRACIQLYHHVASQIDLIGKRVLEVSCGHGGGASWVTRTMRPAQFTGLDLNPTGIEFCQRRHDVDNLSFVGGDAQSLPFPSNSLDVVLNVEASHCYPDLSKFFNEVARVLRPGGHFLYADFRFRDRFHEWESDVAAAPMEVVQFRDISAEVLCGMDLNAERSLTLVHENLPRFLHSLGRDFAGVPDSCIYDALQAGDVSYRSWAMRKV